MKISNALVLIILLSSGCVSHSPGGICELHGVPLRSDTVPIIYGLRQYSAGYRDIQKACFPNARQDVGGGCSVKDLKTATVEFCPKCREVKSTIDSALEAFRSEAREEGRRSALVMDKK
jgi:hypothetical protein